MPSWDVAENPLFNADGTINQDAGRLNPALMERARTQIEQLFYAGQEPWHGLGTGVTEAVTSAEAISLAGLDWQVVLGDVWAGPNHELVTGRKSIYRDTDGKVLGLTWGLKYQPIQNSAVFEFLDSLIADGVMRFETAGSLFGGRKVWVLARLEEDMRIAGDMYYPYVCVVTTHDGTGALKAFPTLIRPVCNNTLMRAVSTAKGPMATVVHSGNVGNKLAAASQLLQVTTGAMRRYTQWLEALAVSPITESDKELCVEVLFGVQGEDMSTQRVHAIEKFDGIYKAEYQLHGDTAYTMVQAVTGYNDHASRLRVSRQFPGEERMTASFGGSIYTRKGVMLNQVQKVLGVKGIEFATAGA